MAINRFSIQVGCIDEFPSNRWDDAVLFFLNGTWSNSPPVTNRPSIVFGRVELRFDPAQNEYLCYGEENINAPTWQVMTNAKHFSIIIRSCGRNDVEAELIRFVKDDNYRKLTIVMSTGDLMFYKGPERADIFVTGNRLKSRPVQELNGKKETRALDRMSYDRVRHDLMKWVPRD
jgi:hypothetical protein